MFNLERHVHIMQSCIFVCSVHNGIERTMLERRTFIASRSLDYLTLEANSVKSDLQITTVYSD